MTKPRGRVSGILTSRSWDSAGEGLVLMVLPLCLLSCHKQQYWGGNESPKAREAICLIKDSKGQVGLLLTLCQKRFLPLGGAHIHVCTYTYALLCTDSHVFTHIH